MKIKNTVIFLGYQALMSALMPFFFARLAWRSRLQPDYKDHWSERLALYPKELHEGSKEGIWIHAVSVGETRACVPLIAAIKTRWPDRSILMTHTTPTGREVSQNLFGDQLTRCYLPYDIPGAMNRFLDRYQPSMGLMIETEVWPGVVKACKNKKIPLCLISGRLSAKSAKGYARLGSLMRDSFAGFNMICAQTEADAQRFQELGSTKVLVTGNLKFDASVDPNEIMHSQDLRTWLGKNRLIFLAASTREGEENLLLSAWKKAKAHESQALLVIVPRHPQRFDEVAQEINESGLSYVRKTVLPQQHVIAEHLSSLDETVKVVLGDTMGEMALWYRSADLAYIGGSLLPFGSQNLLEACARGCPVIIGPHTYNFNQASEEALASGAAERVDSFIKLVERALELLKSPEKRSQMGESGKLFIKRHQGTVERTLKYLEPIFKS
jgi:3-deoxy-D-manno-octulosonic-acid transferase